MQPSDSGSLTGVSNGEACCSGTEQQVHSREPMTTSREMNSEKLNDTRYFIIKSLSHQNIQLSIKKGIWATQVMNEGILEEAFQNSGRVVLIFSVNMSGFFQGYAQMMSSFGWRRDNIWNRGSGKSNHWGRSFKVKWLCLHDLPFHKTLHLKNPWNEFKPVKISRDCQELPFAIGRELCELLDHAGGPSASVKEDGVSDTELSARRSLMQPLHNNFLAPPMQMPPLLYPSFLYQQAEAIRFQTAYQGGEASPGSSHDASHTNSLGLSTERSVFNGTFTEEDLLEMNYEEYLEAYTRGSGKMQSSAGGPTSSLPKSSSSRERSEDSHSGSSSSLKKRKHRQ